MSVFYNVCHGILQLSKYSTVCTRGHACWSCGSVADVSDNQTHPDVQPQLDLLEEGRKDSELGPRASHGDDEAVAYPEIQVARVFVGTDLEHRQPVVW